MIVEYNESTYQIKLCKSSFVEMDDLTMPLRWKNNYRIV
jgi:hypothetical protein